MVESIKGYDAWKTAYPPEYDNEEDLSDDDVECEIPATCPKCGHAVTDESIWYDEDEGYLCDECHEILEEERDYWEEE